MSIQYRNCLLAIVRWEIDMRNARCVKEARIWVCYNKNDSEGRDLVAVRTYFVSICH